MLFLAAHARKGPAPRPARRPADPEQPLRRGLHSTQMCGAPAGLRRLQQRGQEKDGHLVQIPADTHGY